MGKRGNLVHKTLFRSVPRDVMINCLFRSSYVTLLVLLYVMYDSELQCHSVGNAISRKVLLMSIG